MRTRVALLVCVGLVALAAVLQAQSLVKLSPEYEARAKALSADDARGHFELALSMFGQGLYPETAAAGDRLLAIDSGDMRGKYLKALADFYQRGAFVVAPVTQPEPPTPPVPPVAPPQVVNLTDEEVEQIYKRYGLGVLNEFRRLQGTVLARRCATDECHGNLQKSGPFYLKSGTDRKTVAENFRAVERYVDPSNREGSRFLAMTLAPKSEHPGGPVFASDRDAAYVALRSWVVKLPGLWE